MGLLFPKQPPVEYVVFAPSVYEPETVDDLSQFIKTQSKVIAIAGDSTLVEFNEMYSQHLYGDRTKHFALLRERLFPHDGASYVYINTLILENKNQFVNLPCYLAYVNGKIHSFDVIDRA